MEGTNNQPAPVSGSDLQKAVAGDYSFEIGAVISEAWARTKGMKTPFWIGGLLVFMVVLVVGMVLDAVFGVVAVFGDSAVGLILGQILVQVLIAAAVYPFAAGVMMMGVRRAVDLPISYKLVFDYFDYIVPLVVVAILVSILVALGFI